MAEDMTPMEAWGIVSANLMELYKKRNEMNIKPFTDEDIHAEAICFMALRDFEEGRKTYVSEIK